MPTPTEHAVSPKRNFVRHAHAGDLLTPAILVVDDEKQIHSSLKLRLGSNHRLTCLTYPREALALISRETFDLCIVDIRMPEIDGLTFIEQAKALDPALGYVVLSGFDSDENLRRAIPLQVLDFVSKPLPNQERFEKCIPDWVSRTRQRRHEMRLAELSRAIEQDLELARIERDVESTASESAREALLQTANHLTTIQALLLSATLDLDPLHRTDTRLAPIFRGVQEARRKAETAGAVAEGYFGSAYADRESSPAVIGPCLRHAIGISLRQAKAESRQQTVDFSPSGDELVASSLNGIDFLLMVVPALNQTLALAAPGSTVQIRAEFIAHLEDVFNRLNSKPFLWLNRRNASLSKPGILLSIRASCPALEETMAGDWLKGEDSPKLQIPSRGLVYGTQKSKGLLGLAVKSENEKFEIIIALPA